jgi:PST family polysaccharide transporter
VAAPRPDRAVSARSQVRRILDHRVLRNAGALALVQVASYASALVVLVHLTRVLGVDTYGIVAFGVGIVQVASVVLDLGFSMAATPRISVIRDDRAAVARFAGAVLAWKLVAWALGAAVILGYALTTRKYASHADLIAWTALPLLGHALQPIWLFQGLERMRFVTVFTVLARLSFVLLVLVLVQGEADARWVPVADGVAQLAAAAVGLLFIRRVGYGVSRPSRADLLMAMRLTMGFFVSRIASTIQASSGTLLLGLVASPATVGVYALAETLYRAMHAVFATLTHALYPYMARERDFALLRRITLAAVGVAGVGSLVTHFAGPLVIPPLLGEEWRAALPVLDGFLVAIVVHVVVLMITYPLAAAVGRLEVANQAVTVSAFVQGGLVAVLLSFGALTPVRLAWLMVVTEAYLLVHCGALLVPAARRMMAAARPMPVAGA